MAQSTKFAIVETGGKQYKVSVGDSVDIEKLPLEPEASIIFDKILLVSDGQTTQIGQPYVENATVKGKVVSQLKSNKELVFKYKNKTGYKKLQGHRQKFTRVLIETV